MRGRYAEYAEFATYVARAVIEGEVLPPLLRRGIGNSKSESNIPSLRPPKTIKNEIRKM
jgi:hypothetical protein